jgi:hypothetical protein
MPVAQPPVTHAVRSAAPTDNGLMDPDSTVYPRLVYRTANGGVWDGNMEADAPLYPVYTRPVTQQLPRMITPGFLPRVSAPSSGAVNPVSLLGRTAKRK